MQKETKEARRESHAGYHFYNLYRCCPRKFYIKYVLGITPFYTKPPLIFGSSFHEAKATWYLEQNEKAAINKFEDEMDSRETEYENQTKYLTDRERGRLLISTWIDHFGKNDLKYYNVIAVEEQLTVILPNGYILTVRPDAILQQKSTGLYYGMETKTSGWSEIKAALAVKAGNQASAYLYASKKHYPFPLECIIPDVSYQRQSVIKHKRPEMVYRNTRQLQDYEFGLLATLTEISQKIRSLNKYPVSMLFMRNTEWCTSYNSPCEYLDICRTELTQDPPYGFKHDPWVEYDSIVSINYDLFDRVEVEVKQ